jgi:hypothetical protein
MAAGALLGMSEQDGKPSPPSRSIGQLTSQLDRITSICPETRRTNSNHIPDGTNDSSPT